MKETKKSLELKETKKSLEIKPPTPGPGTQQMIKSKFEFEEHPSKIREARVIRQLSQQQMATELDRAHTTYGEIERGRRPVHKETAERIALILRRKLEDLFDSTKRGKKFIAKRVA